METKWTEIYALIFSCCKKLSIVKHFNANQKTLFVADSCWKNGETHNLFSLSIKRQVL